MKLKFLAGCMAAACVLCAHAAPAADVLNTPASSSALAQHALVNGLGNAGQRLVAVGQRGHILFSDDHGATWRQAGVPVSSDLTAVHFPTQTLGWAVGHDGVILHSTDAGASWSVQLDGRKAAQAMQDYYTQSGDARLLEEARRMVEQGPDKPFLDVWFEDAQHGYVAGAFGLLFRTGDGGKSWQPLLHAADNPRALHLNAIRPAAGALYIAGEQGLVLRKAPGAGRFEAVATPYQGSYFGIVGTAQAVIAFGLRGNAFRSSDGGKSWSKVETRVPAGLTAGAVLPGERIVLVSQGGHILASADHGASFTPVPAKPGHAAAVLANGKGGIVIGGVRGLRAQGIDKK